MSTKLAGRAAAAGWALAPGFVVTPPTPIDDIPKERQGTAEAEVARLGAALKQAESELRTLARTVQATAGQAEAEIFEAHAEFTSDPELATLAQEAIAQGASAELAVTQAFATFRELLVGSSSDYLAERATDLDDVRDRVVRILMGRTAGGDSPHVRSVIVARELTPSQTASIPVDVIAGIVTQTGAPTSHAAILARALGVPAVVACPGILDALGDGDTIVAVDGRSGTVIVDPDPSEREEAMRQIEAEAARRDQLSSLRDELGRTADGHRVELAVNIGALQHLSAAVEAGGEGSGLVRTEFLFLDRVTAPTIDEQVGFYLEVLRAFPGWRVVFRTLDVGADKPLPFVERDPEENPALGLRGIRLSLQRPELFRDQLRALLRAGAQAITEGGGRLAIMFPLVSTQRELRQAREILGEVAAEDGVDLSGVEVGVMVEVPSAALGVDRFAQQVDFLSIGTNDLLQYLFAADRLLGSVADLGEILEPDVLSLVGSVAEAGHAHGAWVGVCGEAAGDPTVAAALVGLGIDELSMARVAIPEVKAILRRVTVEQCRLAVQAAIAEAADGPEARLILKRHLGPNLGA